MSPNNTPGEAIDIEMAQEEPAADARQRCLLHKVPMQICSTNPTEHEPSYISVGPYHYKNRGLQLQVRSKLWKDSCVSHVNSQSPRPSSNVLGNEEMTRMITDAQQYYDTDSFCKGTNKDFGKIMVTDGCFILITMNGLEEPTVATGTEGASQRSIKTPNLWEKQFWWHDMFLYGNQIPFVVVQAIYKHIRPYEPELPDTEIALPLRNIEKFVRSGLARFTIREVKNPEKADHILHLCHELLKPTDADKQLVDGRNASDKDKVWRWRRATEYSELLLKFKRRDLRHSAGDAHCISDVRVRGRVVEIPWLELDSETWRLLRNLMLLEQMNPHLGSHVTAYCTFISQVACTGADVNLLARESIIVHREASDEKAAEELSKLCEHIIADPDNNYLKPVWHALDEHCESMYWSVWAKLSRHQDWKNPLVVLSAVVAFVSHAASVLPFILQFILQFIGQPISDQITPT